MQPMPSAAATSSCSSTGAASLAGPDLFDWGATRAHSNDRCSWNSVALLSVSGDTSLSTVRIVAPFGNVSASRDAGVCSGATAAQARSRSISRRSTVRIITSAVTVNCGLWTCELLNCELLLWLSRRVSQPRGSSVFVPENRWCDSKWKLFAAFEGLRGRLFGLAYRMLGSRADAEDIVQEAYVRWHEVTKDRIDNPEAWLVTTTSRLAIDRLRRLKTEREAYVGQWLPQPIVTDAPPDRHLDLADDLSMAFLTLLERLAPEERAAFLLHDVFDVGYPEIASVIEKTESAARQVVHRARERVRGERKRFDVSESAKETLLQRFLAATEARDEQAVLALFAPDATWTADGGGKAAAALRPIVGADRIARLVMGLHERFWANGRTLEIGTINGEAGLCLRDGDRLIATMSIATDGEQILAVYAVVNPDKLG